MKKIKVFTIILFILSIFISCTESNPDYDPDYIPPCKSGSLKCSEDAKTVLACIEGESGDKDFFPVYDCWQDTICNEGFCIPENPQTCELQNECEIFDSTKICTALNTEDKKVATFCIIPPNPNGRESGRACSKHEECLSGWCFKKTCFTPCQDDTNCPFNDTCSTLNVTINGVKAQLKGCVVSVK